MTGTIVNVAGILLCGILGLKLPRQLPTKTQLTLKALLGVATVFLGIKIMWTNMGGGAGKALQQFLIVMLAMMVGRLIGRLLHLQKGMNRLGRYAGDLLAKADPASPNRLSEGFITSTILFCAAPLALIGAILDGLSGHWGALVIKAVLDGLAAMAFVTSFGWGVLLVVLPVAAFQGTISLLAQALAPQLAPDLIFSINATCGMLVMSVSLIILEVKKVEMADYIPSLVVAPLLTWAWF